MIGVALGRDLNVVEQAILAIAVTRLDERHRAGRPATLVELAALLGVLPAELRGHPHLGVAHRDRTERVADRAAARPGPPPRTDPARHVRRALDRAGRLDVGCRDHPRPVGGVRQPRSAAAGAADRQRLAVRNSSPPCRDQNRRGILVEDEVWATTASERSAKALQARLKLCRLYGIWNILVTHRLSDLRAQADDGSSASKVAEGLIGDIQTKVVFRQATDQLADATRLLRLNDKTTALLPELTKGRALWLVAGRKAVVHHVLGGTKPISPTPTRRCRPERDEPARAR